MPVEIDLSIDRVSAAGSAMYNRMTPSAPSGLPRSDSFGWRIVTVALLLAVALLAGEYGWLRARRESAAVVRANESVADKIATARAHLALQHWDQAIYHLEDALATEKATNRDEARPLLAQARQGQADALLEAADAAIARKDSARAFRLLRAYLAHPGAADPGRARRLREDLERATSEEEAVHLLEHLPDDALDLLARRGQLTEDDGLRTAGARAIFQDTLRRHLAKELRKRAAQHEIERLAAERRAAQRARRIARLRHTPAFRALSGFVAQTREQLREQEQSTQQQEAALAQLFQQLRVNDPTEQATIRADLLERGDRNDLAQLVDRQRAAVKRVYRSSPEYDADDHELFDQLVDRELDELLRALSPLFPR
jgi:hypothetical protein